MSPAAAGLKIDLFDVSCYLTLGKLLKLPKYCFPHLLNGSKVSACFRVMVTIGHEKISVKHLAQPAISQTLKNIGW